MKITKSLTTLLACLGISLTSSCIQMEQSHTVNPDGSGKFTVKASVDFGGMEGLLGGGGEGGGKKKGADPTEEMVRNLIKGTKGVEVWEEAKVVKGADGKSQAVVTGYFKDITKVKISSDVFGGGKSGGGGSPTDSIKSTKDADGNWILGMDLEAAAKEADKEAGSEEKDKPKQKLTDEELDQKLLEAQQGMAMMKGMMGAMLASAKISNEFIVGGEIKDSGMFEKVDGKTARLEMKPAKMFDGIEKLFGDKEKVRPLLESGGNPMEMLGGKGSEKFMKEMLEGMVGRSGEPRLVIKPGEPVFNYEEAVKKARQNQSPELKKMLEELKSDNKDEKLPKAA